MKTTEYIGVNIVVLGELLSGFKGGTKELINRKELGIKKKKRTVVYNDLDHLAGTWSDKDFEEFLQATADFDKIDENMWK